MYLVGNEMSETIRFKANVSGLMCNATFMQAEESKRDLHHFVLRRALGAGITHILRSEGSKQLGDSCHRPR